MKTLTANMRGYFFFITGLLACPCHLPVTLPLLIALTAGTALGAFLSNNVWIVVALSTLYFIVALALGFRYLGQEKQVCEVPQHQAQTKSQFKSKRAKEA